jgi:hypothetical protein
MQTLHSLRSFRDLRTISLELRPSRWPTRSAAPKWETAPPLPPQGSARSAAKRSPGAFPGSCLTPLRPTCAVGWRTAPTRRQFNPDTPLLGAGLLTALWKRWPQNDAQCGPVPRQVCRAALVRKTTGAAFVPPSPTRLGSWQELRLFGSETLPRSVSGWRPLATFRCCLFHRTPSVMGRGVLSKRHGRISGR